MAGFNWCTGGWTGSLFVLFFLPYWLVQRREKCLSEEMQKRGQQKDERQWDCRTTCTHTHKHVRTRCTLSWAHKDTSWTQRCSSCTWSIKFLLPRFDERTLWAAWSVSCNWSGSVYLSESFSLRGKPHNHQTQRIKKMFMWKLCFFSVLICN